MKNLLKYISLLTLSLAAACSTIPPEAYYARGAPESLLDVSSEIVNLDIDSHQSVDELSQWIAKDQPTRAELYCSQRKTECMAAQDVLDLHGVESHFIPSAENMVTLVYERVLARDCENRYIDNPVNPYHLNHPTFGCSTAANIVQMVSSKKQFVRPSILGPQDARKAVQAYQGFLIPGQLEQDRGLDNSLLGEAQIN